MGALSSLPWVTGTLLLEFLPYDFRTAASAATASQSTKGLSLPKKLPCEVYGSGANRLSANRPHSEVSPLARSLFYHYCYLLLLLSSNLVSTKVLFTSFSPCLLLFFATVAFLQLLLSYCSCSRLCSSFLSCCFVRRCPLYLQTSLTKGSTRYPRQRASHS